MRIILGLMVAVGFIVPSAHAEKTCLKSYLKKGKIKNLVKTVANGARCPSGYTAIVTVTTPATPTPTSISPTLESGKTLRGSWGTFQDLAAPAYMASTVSFGWNLSAVPTPHYIPQGDTVPAGCSGNHIEPGADPGHLCVFERNRVNANNRTIFDPPAGLNDQASKYGFGVFWQGSAGFSSLYGSWAVTAP